MAKTRVLLRHFKPQSRYYFPWTSTQRDPLASPVLPTGCGKARQLLEGPEKMHKETQQVLRYMFFMREASSRSYFMFSILCFSPYFLPLSAWSFSLAWHVSVRSRSHGPQSRCYVYVHLDPYGYLEHYKRAIPELNGESQGTSADSATLPKRPRNWKRTVTQPGT